ncbi:unnamed protein product [Urochloa decumbens]|uniref:DUF1618 domain-containing protein n=1 Tax=Urochloa decumbens TaxID=240449 RepID=A0ABC9GWH8_9POAL
MAPPSWIILSTAPRVSAPDALPDGADLSLALAAPPGLSHLTVSTRVSPADPDPHARLDSPYVLAADPSGLLLAITPPPLSASSPATERVRRGPDGVERTFHISYIPDPDYAVLDVASATARRLPGRDILSPATLGVIASPSGSGGFMVVEFQFIVGGTGASLYCFSSHTGAWVEKKVRNPLPRWIWNFSDVLSHNGKLWWVDTAAGLLACDPFADNPDMAYVPLPPPEDGDEAASGDCGCYYCSERMIASRRRIQLSNGTFRCGQIASPPRKPKDHAAAAGPHTVTMRTLADPETAHWTLDYKVPLADIWADHTYKAAGLPEKEPVLAFIHPNNPDVLYFSLDHYLFAVDMRAKKLVECQAHESAVSPSSLFAWELPPAFTAPAAAGLPENGIDSGPASA